MRHVSWALARERTAIIDNLHDPSMGVPQPERLPPHRGDDLVARIMETSPAGITVVDRHGQIVFANARAEQILGLTRDQITSRTYNAPAWRITDFGGQPFPDEELPFVKVMTTGQPVNYVHHAIEWPDGRRIFLSINGAPLHDSQGEIEGVVFALADITKRHLAEEALRESERRYRGLFDSMLNGLALQEVICDDSGQPVDCRFIEVNPAFERLTGLSASEVTGKTVREVLSEVEPFWAETLGRVALTGEPAHFQSYARALGRYYEVSAFCPKTGTFAASFADITEQRRAQEQIAFQASLLDQVRNAVIAIDLDRRITYWSRYAERLYGWSAAEVVGRNVIDVLVPEEERDLLMRVIADARPRGRWEGEFQLRRKDGSRLPAYVVDAPLRNGEGNLIGFVGVSTDMSDRKLADQALRESEARYRSLYGAVQAGILVQNAEGVILDANERAAEILGCPRTELLGRSSRAPEWNVVREDGTPFPVEEYPGFRAVRTGQVVGGVTMGITPPGGERKWVLVHSSPLVDEETQTALGVVSTLVDITEYRRLEDELRQAQKMEAVGRLAGGVAHDFNNLLVPILTYAQILSDRLRTDDPLRRYAEQILKTAERAASLPRQLLAFSRKQVLQPKVLDLNALIGDMGKMLQRLIGEDIALTMLPDSALDRVKADPGQVEQVLLNLAVNARDAMPHGGKLTIETANVDVDEAYARPRPEMKPGRYVTFAVTDTGCGMDRETQAHIWEPFFTTKEQGKGTGLGLSTVYGIVKQSGGEVHVYSEPGMGSTFRVYLPSVEETPAATVTAQHEDAPGGRAEVVLLVEDDAAVRESIRDVLQSFGYTVLTASSGEEALALSAGHDGPIHLALTDVVMPGMSGRQWTTRLAGQRPETAVVYMSGYTEDAIVHHGVLEEGIAFLQKPFTPGALARKIREVLDAPRRHPR